MRRKLALGSPFLGPRRRQIAGMQVVNHCLRFNLEGVHQMGKRLAEEFETGKILKVAEMLALVGKPAARQRKDILEMSADREQRRRLQMAAAQPAEQTRARGESTAARRRPAPSPSRRSAARISRSCIRNASAIFPSRASASPLSIAIGSSLRFALVITSARTRESAKSKCCNGA